MIQCTTPSYYDRSSTAHHASTWGAMGGKRLAPCPSSSTQQNDTKSCGVYALACIYCLVTGTAIPTSLDPRLWRQAVAALAGAANLPLLPHRVVEPSLEQMTTVGLVSKQGKLAQSLKDWIVNADILVAVLSRLEKALKNTASELSTANEDRIVEQLRQVLPGAKSLRVTEGGACTCSDRAPKAEGPFTKAHATYLAKHRAFELQVERLKSRMNALRSAAERSRHATKAFEKSAEGGEVQTGCCCVRSPFGPILVGRVLRCRDCGVGDRESRGSMNFCRRRSTACLAKSRSLFWMFFRSSIAFGPGSGGLAMSPLPKEVVAHQIPVALLLSLRSRLYVVHIECN